MTEPTKKRGPAGNRTSQQSSQGSRTANDTALPGALLLISGLEAAGYVVETIGHGHWKAQCPNPEHEDEEPSLGIDVRAHRYTGLATVLVNCPACKAGLKEACEAAGVPQWKVLDGNGALLHSQRPAAPAEDLSPVKAEAKVRRYREALLTSPKRLAYLHEQRGLSLATIEYYQIGYDEGLDKYVLPVRDGQRRIVNFRRYLPGAPAGMKMRNASGHGSPPRLYPSLPGRGWVLMVEGEWDALVALQHGLPACTGTHGTTWLPQWSPLMADRKVVFAFDCDDAGRNAAAKYAADVAKHASEVRVLDLGLEDREDVSDWFVKYGRSADELVAVIRTLSPLGEEGE